MKTNEQIIKELNSIMEWFDWKAPDYLRERIDVREALINCLRSDLQAVISWLKEKE